MDNINKIFSRIISDEILAPEIPLAYLLDFKPGFSFGPHNHESVEVICILSGSCYIVVDNEHIRLRKNECLIIFPDRSHSHYQEKDQTCRILNVHFIPGDISVFFNIPDLQNNLRFFYELKTHTMRYLRLTDNGFMRFTSECIYKESKNKNKFSEITQKLHFCQLFVHLSTIIDNNYSIFKKPLNKHVNSALEYICNCCNDKISMEQIAEQVGISPRQLSRLFNEELDMSTQDFITIFRIEKAKKLLKATDLNITQIAQSLGYNTSEYFTVCFKKYQMISPKKYREINK